MTEAWCFICEWDAKNCDMCKQNEPGQLGLFANEVLIEPDLADDSE